MGKHIAIQRRIYICTLRPATAHRLDLEVETERRGFVVAAKETAKNLHIIHSLREGIYHDRHTLHLCVDSEYDGCGFGILVYIFYIAVLMNCLMIRAKRYIKNEQTK